MKAVIQNAYGSPDVLHIREMDRPDIKEYEVLVEVCASSINAGDLFTVRGRPWAVRLALGMRRPKNHIPGWDVAGWVSDVGAKVTQFHPGDEVFGSCENTFAEYVSADTDSIAKKPGNLTYTEAASVPSAGLTALQGLVKHGNLESGQKVLINGASGGVGTYAVQIARSHEAEVTGVCSTAKMDMVRSIGAHYVIDYTREDFTQNGQQYDLILDNAGNRKFSELRRVLSPEGIILPNSGHGGMGYVIKGFVLSALLRRQGRPWITQPNSRDLETLRELIESQELTPVIDRTYSLEEIREAVEYLESGQVRGKVGLSIRGNDA